MLYSFGQGRDALEVLFSLLGPLQIADGDRNITLDAPKQRALLVLLLLPRGEPIAVESLAEELWAGEPPATGTRAVRMYVGELWKALGAEVIVTQGAGHAIPLEGHETDLGRFEELAADGGRWLVGGNAERAATTLREALGLWRGSALADFRYDDFAQNEITRLDEARIAARKVRIDADLALGREDELVPELQALVREHPLRERLRGQLMLALYRAGRQAEALDVYRVGRRRLVEELGIEPSRSLQEIERAILAHDESIGPPRRRPLSRATERVGAEVPVSTTPAAVSVGDRAVWVLNADDQKAGGWIENELERIARPAVDRAAAPR
jgi:DNA-binding SARP family transcriptional activator